jgi:hypothetical protein
VKVRILDSKYWRLPTEAYAVKRSDSLVLDRDFLSAMRFYKSKFIAPSTTTSWKIPGLHRLGGCPILLTSLAAILSVVSSIISYLLDQQEYHTTYEDRSIA